MQVIAGKQSPESLWTLIEEKHLTAKQTKLD
jgi:hypothetical protein